MIRSVERETEKIWNGRRSLRLPCDIQNIARRKLRMIDAAIILEDLRIPPANRLEKLKGELDAFYSIRINDQYRIIFRFENGDAYDVEVRDYH